MKKYLLLGFIFLVLDSFTQTNLSNDTIQWSSARPLALSDFKGEIIDGIVINGEIFCMNLANFEKKGAFQKTKYSVYAIFDRSKSWVNSKLQTNDGLIYFQTIFNIYEVHARKLRRDFSETQFGSDPTTIFQEKYNSSMSNLTNEYTAFRKETKLGSNLPVLKKWQTKVEEELKELDTFKN